MLPLVPRYVGTHSRSYRECEKHMYEKYTNCILCCQKRKSYSQPLPKNMGDLSKQRTYRNRFLFQRTKKRLFCCNAPTDKLYFYFESPMTFVFCSSKFVALCFIFRHMDCYVFCFKLRLKFSFRF